MDTEPWSGAARARHGRGSIANRSAALLDTGEHRNGPLSQQLRRRRQHAQRRSGDCAFYGSICYDRRQNRSEAKKPWRRLFCGVTTSTFTVWRPNCFAASREGK
jgi:hypothetical protein